LKAAIQSSDSKQRFKAAIQRSRTNTMNVQTKAAAIKKKRKVQTKAAAIKKKRKPSYLNVQSKELYIKQALTAKRLGKVKSLVEFWRTVPELNEAIGKHGWYQAARQSEAIVKAFNLKATGSAIGGTDDSPIVEDQVSRPPRGGLFLRQDGDMYLYECGCRVSVSCSTSHQLRVHSATTVDINMT
jgi:hypothetical protein